MFKKIIDLFKKEKPIVEEPKKPRRSFSNDEYLYSRGVNELDIAQAVSRSIQQNPPIAVSFKNTAMDSVTGKASFQTSMTTIPDSVFCWFANQGFIGYQAAAILSQHWLISKCCLMPAQDAIRMGFEITVNDGTEVKAEVLDEMRRLDKLFRLRENLVEFIQMGRIYGVRVAMFEVETDNPADYYSKPFNPDGIKPGTYRGISQIDPFWMTPQLDGIAAGDPMSKHFYEPTWWQVRGIRVHRTHLVIFRTEQVPDTLKPTYLYGGIPIPQKIYERVYAAERTANEAPLLALTKRTTVVKVDLAQAIANQRAFDERMELWSRNWTNYGLKVIDESDEVEQFDTSLADLDAVIMSQFQLVAAAANVPAVKLLGTSPKGFNATGEYEEASYHEELQSIQAQSPTDLINRHHLLLIRSEIAPMFNIPIFSTTVDWNPLDAMTAKEEADVNLVKAQTGATLSSSGSIDGQDERNRIINDPASGYSGLIDDLPNEDVDSEVDD